MAELCASASFTPPLVRLRTFSPPGGETSANSRRSTTVAGYRSSCRVPVTSGTSRLSCVHQDRDPDILDTLRACIGRAYLLTVTSLMLT